MRWDLLLAIQRFKPYSVTQKQFDRILTIPWIYRNITQRVEFHIVIHKVFSSVSVS